MPPPQKKSITEANDMTFILIVLGLLFSGTQCILIVVKKEF